MITKAEIKQREGDEVISRVVSNAEVRDGHLIAVCGDFRDVVHEIINMHSPTFVSVRWFESEDDMHDSCIV